MVRERSEPERAGAREEEVTQGRKNIIKDEKRAKEHGRRDRKKLHLLVDILASFHRRLDLV